MAENTAPEKGTVLLLLTNVEDSSRDAISSESEECAGTAMNSSVISASVSSGCRKELSCFDRCVVRLPSES